MCKPKEHLPQSHICLTFKFTLFFPIHPSVGQLTKYSGHVPGRIFGTECHAHLLSRSIITASPELILMTSTSGESSRPITNSASQPIERETNAAEEDSEMSRWGESVSPGE